MNTESENRLKHFAALKSKYQASNYQDSSPSSLLYLILRKVDLGIELTELEFDWLKEHKLFESIQIICQQQQSKLEELRKLENEFSDLKSKYQVPKVSGAFKNISIILYPILWKLNSEKTLTASEIEWLKNNQLSGTVAIAKNMELEKNFFDLKVKYQATQYQCLSVNSPLYKILNKLENKQTITAVQFEWLLREKLFITADFFKIQESNKQAEFAKLKDKYKANKNSYLSLSIPLYSILQKIDAQKDLVQSEINWLEQQGLNETITIAQQLEQTRDFTALKIKYKATEYHDSSPNSHLYKILKRLDLSNQLSEQDINFLKKRKLTEIIKIANEKYVSSLKYKINSGELLNDLEIDWLKNNKHQEIIILAQQNYFAILKRKYGLIDPDLTMEPFYTIMIKLEKKERLAPILVFNLIEKSMLSRDGKIAVAHYRLEAEFYEQEIKRTGHKWHIPTASSYWRKANEPEQALKITNLDLTRIKESNLKSAILVTRGAAFRDIDNLDDAESCARKAMEYQPNSYQPYTLMGAIYYDRGGYVEGDCWFEQAIQRGAKSEDIDDELKRVFRSTKDENKRHEAAEYLLKKDSKRYSWAKSYLKKSQDNHK
ncbi:MAG: hypothetical protein RM338_07520 [Nostoc sp. DedQUE12a]|nr:hypothetical protein [Nostoc sp. DedQUE12a]